MKVSELNTLYGFDVTEIKDIYKRHLIFTTIFILFDIVLITVLTYIMYHERADIRTYVGVMFGVSIVASFLYSFYARPKEYNVCKFYNSIKNLKLVEESFDVDENKLYSLTYCLGFKKIKINKEADYYKEIILNYCYNDIKKATKFYKYLMKYANNNNDGDLVIYTVKKLNKIYFVDFVSKNSSSQDKENEDGDY